MSEKNDDCYILDQSMLRKYFEDGCKPKKDWGIGAEYESFIFSKKTKQPIKYSGTSSISSLFDNFIQKFGWRPIRENGFIIGLEKGDANISLEPGGQFELSGGIKSSVHEVQHELQEFIREMEILTTELNIGMFSLGTAPTWILEDMPLMPKDRYEKIMAPYMKTVGKFGLDMMFRTCTIQVNLDYSSEEDMAKKLKVASVLQPMVTAMFASSPFFETKDTGYDSWRANIWKHTDHERTGIPKFIFDTEMGFSKWIDFALDVPMYFIKRNGKYLDFTGKSFRSFLDGQLKDMPGEKPLYSDWINHLTTIFTDVRLKSFIEMRGADGGPSYNVTALAAFWTGLLYDTEGLNSIVDLTYDWTWQETNNLNLDVCKYGLNAEFRGKKIWDLAKDILGISLLGLKNRNVRQNEHDEGIYLSPLFEMLETKKNLSTILRERYGDKRESNVQKVFEEFNFFHGFQN